MIYPSLTSARRVRHNTQGAAFGQLVVDYIEANNSKTVITPDEQELYSAQLTDTPEGFDGVYVFRGPTRRWEGSVFKSFGQATLRYSMNGPQPVELRSRFIYEHNNPQVTRLVSLQHGNSLYGLVPGTAVNTPPLTAEHLVEVMDELAQSRMPSRELFFRGVGQASLQRSVDTLTAHIDGMLSTIELQPYDMDALQRIRMQTNLWLEARAPQFME